MRDYTTFTFFVVFVGLAVTHYLAQQWYLYWLYPWFDNPIHFWGGFTVALGSQTPTFASLTHMRPKTVLGCVVLVLGIGILWEVFEWLYVINDMSEYVIDTTLDLVMDVLGGIFGFFIIKKVGVRAQVS